MSLEPKPVRSTKTGPTAIVPAKAKEENIARSQSLYRKWRSQTFGELVGQDAITRTLQNAIVSGRVGHAYLFCGPRGTGKTSSARLLAKALNCTNPEPRARPCNECEACRAIAEGRAMDLIEIDAASNRGIDEIRSLRDTIGYQPSQFRYKFYIIDEVHMLTEPAFNALLKTLEEPPPHAIFVLATTDPQDIPATVVSRCQRFDFQRISLEQIAARLGYICEQEDIQVETGALELVARQATGSLRDALSLLDQLIVFSGEVIRVEDVRAMLGVMNSEAVAEFVDCLIAQDMAGGLELINQLVQSGTDLKRFNREVVDHLRALMLIKANPGSGELTDMTREALEGLNGQAARLDLGEIVGFLKIFSGVDYNLKVSPYGHLPLEIALMEAILNRPAQAQVIAPQPRPNLVASVPRPAERPVERPIERPVEVPVLVVQPAPAKSAEAVIKEPTPLRVVAEKPVPAQPAPLPTAARALRVGLVSSGEKATDKGQEEEAGEQLGLELGQAKTAWEQVLKNVGASSKMTQALLLEARPIAVDGSYIVLAFRWEFHHKQISQDTTRRVVVENFYSEVVGQKVLIRCVLDSDTSGGGSASDGSDKAARPAQERNRRAAEVFNARILD